MFNRQKSMSTSAPPSAEVDIDTLLGFGSTGIPGGIPKINSSSKVTPSRFGKIEGQSVTFRKARSKSDTNADEIDIDTILSMGNDQTESTTHSSLTNIAGQSSLKQSKSSFFKMKRSGSSSGFEKSSQNLKDNRKHSNLSTSKPIIATSVADANPKNTLVVDLDTQDIDMFIKVSKYHTKKDDSGRKNSTQSTATSISPSDTTESAENQTSFSVDTNNSGNSDVPLVKTSIPEKTNWHKTSKSLVYKTSENRSLTLPPSQTDIDMLVSVPEQMSTLEREKAKSWSKSQQQFIDVNLPVRTSSNRPRAQTLITGTAKRDDLITSYISNNNNPIDALRKFHSAIFISPEYGGKSGVTDIDAILDISTMTNEVIGMSIKTVDAIERPQESHIDSDFIFNVSDQSQQGSQEYRKLLRNPEYRANHFHTMRTTKSFDIDESISVQTRYEKVDTKKQEPTQKADTPSQEAVHVNDVVSNTKEGLDIDNVINVASENQNNQGTLRRKNRMRAKSELELKNGNRSLKNIALKSSNENTPNSNNI